MSRLEALLNEVKLAQSSAKAELMRLYPKGAQIRFTIMHGQLNASTGTVACSGWKEGYLRVKHHEAKPNSRYAYRDVHFSQVIE